MMKHQKFAALLALLSVSTDAFVVAPRSTTSSQSVSSVLRASSDPIISPFDNSAENSASTTGTVATETLQGPLELTWENVEKVLDEMRPFLIQDGGNVAITDIDGPVVRLELQVRKHENLVEHRFWSLLKMIPPHSMLPLANRTTVPTTTTGCLWNVPLFDSNHEDGFGTWFEGKDSRNSGSHSVHARGS